MTNEELIEVLKKYPKDAAVEVSDWNEGYAGETAVIAEEIHYFEKLNTIVLALPIP